MFKKGNRANTLHGILLIALFSFAAFYIAEIPFVRRLSFSPLIVGIILGMLYANSLRNKLPETWVPGIKFCTKQVLRWGIILYGFRLTLSEVAAVGIPAVAVDVIIVTVTILGGVLLGRMLRMDGDTALMTSTGSAICGAAAVLGAEPVVKCEGYKTAIAVSTVVLFGTLSMFVYPLMYRTGMLSGLTDTGVAVYTGSTLHEVAHVAGAGNAMDPTDALGIAGTATITKMIRVMLLAPVLIVMGFVLARRRKSGRAAADNNLAMCGAEEAAVGTMTEQRAYEGVVELCAVDGRGVAVDPMGGAIAADQGVNVPAADNQGMQLPDHKTVEDKAASRESPRGKRQKSKITVPWFAFGFIGVICLNSLLQYLFGAESVREIPLNGTIEYIDTFMLTMAMTALGTETSIDKFRQAGAKPFLLAGLLYVWLVVGGYFVTKYLVGIL